MKKNWRMPHFQLIFQLPVEVVYARKKRNCGRPRRIDLKTPSNSFFINTTTILPILVHACILSEAMIHEHTFRLGNDGAWATHPRDDTQTRDSRRQVSKKYLTALWSWADISASACREAHEQKPPANATLANATLANATLANATVANATLSTYDSTIRRGSICSWKSGTLVDHEDSIFKYPQSPASSVILLQYASYLRRWSTSTLSVSTMMKHKLHTLAMTLKLRILDDWFRKIRQNRLKQINCIKISNCGYADGAMPCWVAASPERFPLLRHTGCPPLDSADTQFVTHASNSRK